MENKFEEAAGLFWGASVFVGGLIAVLLGFLTSTGWIFSGVVGVLSFLIIGLVTNGILKLVSKRR